MSRGDGVALIGLATFGLAMWASFIFIPVYVLGAILVACARSRTILTGVAVFGCLFLTTLFVMNEAYKAHVTELMQPHLVATCLDGTVPPCERCRCRP